MTEHELSLINKSINEMNPEDVARIMTEVSHVKRFLDIISLIPGSRDEYIADKQGFIKDHELRLTAQDIDFLYFPEAPKEKLAIISDPKRLSEMPESFFRYRQFFANKIAYRDEMIKKLCEPSNDKMKKWRQRQIRRCDGVLGGLNGSFVHTVVTYELASGCSVGCSFCGLDAGPLRKIFRYTPENKELFRDVIRRCHKVLGDAAGHGMMYFATEPLDNPDYEQFENDFYEEFHNIPQITTAVFDRDIERTRRLINGIANGRGFVHRFTLRSLEMAKTALEKYSPEELLMVELLPQFPEAPAFVPYVKVGREIREEQSDAPSETDQGTICCVDGFCINFPEKRFRLISPERVCERYPKGIYESGWIDFESGEDLEKKLERFIDDHLEQDIPNDKKLSLYDYLYIGEHKGRRCIISRYGEAIPLKETYMEEIAKLLETGLYDRRQIASQVAGKNLTTAENAFWYLNRLWDGGCIKERIFDE